MPSPAKGKRSEGRTSAQDKSPLLDVSGTSSPDDEVGGQDNPMFETESVSSLDVVAPAAESAVGATRRRGSAVVSHSASSLLSVPKAGACVCSFCLLLGRFILTAFS